VVCTAGYRRRRARASDEHESSHVPGASLRPAPESGARVDLRAVRRPRSRRSCCASCPTVVAATGLITGAQIKNGSITGLDIRNGSLGLGDLNRLAVRALGEEAEGVPVAANPDVSAPVVLVNELVSDAAGADRAEATLTTPRDGQLLLLKSFASELLCLTDGDNVWWWLTRDGAPVRSTLTLAYSTRGDLQPTTLAGVTDVAVKAGSHVLGIGAMCASSSPVRPFTFYGSGGTAIVLG
jgi:hypothetical protein